MKEVLVLRESDGYEFAGRLHGAVKFSTEFRRKTEGTTQRVMAGDRVVGVGKMTFRGSELWITDIEITVPAGEVTGIEAAP